jgi:hypothetical protein
MQTLPFALNPDTLTIALFGTFLIAVILFVWIIVLEMRLKRFMRGESGANLEGIMRTVMGRYDEFESFQKEMARALNIVDKRLKTAARGVGTVRFDAFAGDGSGGMQSFATALVSENGDGVVISSLHARASTRIFAKPVRAFTSEHELTEEEQKAIDTARSHTAL